MINLIPPQGHQAVRKEYFMRVGATYAVLFGVVAILLAVALVPTYVLVRAQMREFATAVDPKSDGGDIGNIEEEVTRTEAIVAELRNSPDVPRMSTIIQEIEKSAHAGIEFRTFTAAYAEDEMSPIQVQGVAQRREDLVALKQTLEAHPLFETATVPLADLARERDVAFTITILLAEEQR